MKGKPMYPRVNYEMTEEDLKAILDACKPVPCMMIGAYAPASPQENANRAWSSLGKKMGFDPMTVQPIQGKGQRGGARVIYLNLPQHHAIVFFYVYTKAKSENLTPDQERRLRAAVETIKREFRHETERHRI